MKFLRDGTVYAAGNIASAAVPFLLLPFLTRVLGPGEYGKIISFALIMTICLTIAGLNIHSALGVIWFQQPKEEIPLYIGTGLGLALASTLLFSPIVSLCIWLFPGLGGGLSPLWGGLAGLAAGSTIISQARLVLWQSQRKPFMNVSLQFATSVLNVGLSLLGVVFLKFGGAGRNGGIACANLIIAAISWWLFYSSREIKWAPTKKQINVFVKFGAPLILHSFAAVMLASSDRWIVSIRLGPEVLGIYGAGAQLGAVISILADAFIKSYGPWIYSKLSSGKEGDKYCAVGAIYAAMPMFSVLATMVGVVLMLISGFLLGPKYQQATNIIPWFMAGGAMSGIYLCTSGLYFFSGRTGLLAFVTISAAALGMVTSWVLAGRYGLVGAAIGYAVTQLYLGLLATIVSMRSFDLPWWEPRRAFFAWYRNLKE